MSTNTVFSHDADDHFHPMDEENYLEGGSEISKSQLGKKYSEVNGKIKYDISYGGKKTASGVECDADPKLKPMNRAPVNEEDAADIIKERQEFTKKTFAHFSLQVGVMSAYVLFIVNKAMSPVEMYTKEIELLPDAPDGNPADHMPEDYKGNELYEFATNDTLKYVALTLFVISIVLCLMPSLKYQRQVGLGYGLLAVHTISLAYLAGWIAAISNKKIVLISLIGALTIAALMCLLAGKIAPQLIKQNRKNKKQADKFKALGQYFGIMATAVVMTVFVAMMFGDIGTTPTIILVVAMVVGCGYFFIDTFLILNGQYNNVISQEDYIYGSVKLSTDFVLIFGAMTMLCAGQGDGA